MFDDAPAFLARAVPAQAKVPARDRLVLLTTRWKLWLSKRGEYKLKLTGQPHSARLTGQSAAGYVRSVPVNTVRLYNEALCRDLLEGTW